MPKVAEPTAEAVSLTQSGSEAGEAISYSPAPEVQKILDAIAVLSLQDKDLIKSTLSIEDEKNRFSG